MPGIHLEPTFFTYHELNFTLGGNPALVGEAARRWMTFADAAEGAAVSLRAINDGGFEGTEGNTYRDIVNANFPSHLQTTSEAHQGVGSAISRYAGAFTTAMAAMTSLRTRAMELHTAVNATGVEVDTAEAAAATAHEAATTATVASIAMPAAAPAAVTAHATATAADAELAKAVTANQIAFNAWTEAIAESEVIKNELGAEVTAAVGIIEAQARKRFEKNPSKWEKLKGALSDFLDKFADLLKNLSDLLQTLGGFMMLIPGLQLIGAIMLGVGLALKGLLALNGNVSWGEFALDALFALPGGALLRGARAGKLGVTGMRAAAGLERVGGKAVSTVKTGLERGAFHTASGMGRFGERGQNLGKAFYERSTRGGQICFDAEPVDMATGAMVDFEVDVNVPGVLPLIVDRNANSAHELGRALGPTWVSRMDVRIEVCADEVLMVSSDGALLTFPPAPTDGSEVRCDGRPWLLSFVDGAYRVRDVAGGVTWVFAVTGDRASVRSVLAAEPGSRPEADNVTGGVTGGVDGGVDDLDAVDRELAALCGAGIPGSSLAGVTETGIEIGLTSLVHRTGHWVDYDYDPATATMTRMRRSDGT
uniref:DUF6531 domain-containing protein n=1 Tax=uncultured Corynebacterium sp. TaxID=159447 RepID=UPI0025E51E25